MELNILEHCPTALLNTAAEDLWQLLPGPTLIKLRGRNNPPLLVSVLLHGNEVSGWLAARQLLQKYLSQSASLPRTLWLFIGNIEAARQGMRHLPGQRDFNRIWELDGDSQPLFAKQLLEMIQSESVLAVIDVHNNTGKNPHYACVSQLDQKTLAVASQFSRRVIFFEKPVSALSVCCSQLVPVSLTLECGQSGNQSIVNIANDFLESCLKIHSWDSLRFHTHDAQIYETAIRIEIAPDIKIGSLDDDQADLCLYSNLEDLNFVEQDPGTPLGILKTFRHDWCSIIERGQHLKNQKYIAVQQGVITLTEKLVPAMFTQDPLIIHQDCLGYLMRPSKVKAGKFF